MLDITWLKTLFCKEGASLKKPWLYFPTVWIWKKTLKGNFLSFEHCSILSGCHHVTGCQMFGGTKNSSANGWKSREHLNGLGKTGGCRGCICCHREKFLCVLRPIQKINLWPLQKINLWPTPKINLWPIQMIYLQPIQYINLIQKIFWIGRRFIFWIGRRFIYWISRRFIIWIGRRCRWFIF